MHISPIVPMDRNMKNAKPISKFRDTFTDFKRLYSLIAGNNALLKFIF